MAEGMSERKRQLLLTEISQLNIEWVKVTIPNEENLCLLEVTIDLFEGSIAQGTLHLNIDIPRDFPFQPPAVLYVFQRVKMSHIFSFILDRDCQWSK